MTNSRIYNAAISVIIRLNEKMTDSDESSLSGPESRAIQAAFHSSVPIYSLKASFTFLFVDRGLFTD